MMHNSDNDIVVSCLVLLKLLFCCFFICLNIIYKIRYGGSYVVREVVKVKSLVCMLNHAYLIHTLFCCVLCKFLYHLVDVVYFPGVLLCRPSLSRCIHIMCKY